MRKEQDLTYEEVDAVLRYDPETGKLWWRVRPRHFFASDRLFKSWNSQNANKEALTATIPGGYLKGSIFTAQCLAHRVAWLLATGAWPKGNIDHINGVKTDNSLGNLRDVSTSENARNAKRAVTNTSGVTGVCWDAGAGKWRASIKLNNKLKYLGVFEDLQAASAARAEANKRYGFSARHGVDPTGAQVLEVVRVRRKGATV